ncbi:hypothetical protein N781_14580 [Pontibacillus halophilus JSM 076056 = DSM 19796]|uniref:Na+/H+ antiporter NhaC-like C-terminal domain-containing protein n=1 Tax=Pontibacillus halophilus JSM 076056 = DSM 19796 TaxID=1385510 RepID=A0A0A5IAB0_9BACI|nr:Na+/H+ antiporter NhaC family protein [Pontibacillus halophilus]KGX92772.1 hypothetical protein N781_14580 [Pontibacillus halophilus JSM 076056 = DSM 19796]
MKQSFLLREIVLILTITIGVLMVAVVHNFSMTLAIVPGFAILLYFFYKKGYTHAHLRDAITTGIKRNKEVAWLLMFVGMVLPTWKLAGTVEDMNTVFLSFISADHFLMMTFLVTMLMSLVIGSAVGSLSVVGVPVMAAAGTIDVSLGYVAGALVSGAFVGDRTSPLSTSFQLIIHSLDLNVRRQLLRILPTLIGSVLVTVLAYFVMDLVVLDVEAGAFSSENLDGLSTPQLVISLLPPFVLMVAILWIGKTKHAFMLSIGTALVVLMIRGESVIEWSTLIFTGFDSHTGIFSMLPFIVFILVVGVFSQIIEDTEMLQPYIDKVFTNSDSLTKNTWQTVGVAFGIAFISPNQSFPVILTGRALKPHWEANFSKGQLGRIIADTTVVFTGMVPWSMLALLCAALVGVPVLDFVPFAFFLLITPFMTILASWWTERRQAKRAYEVGEQHVSGM